MEGNKPAVIKCLHFSGDEGRELKFAIHLNVLNDSHCQTVQLHQLLMVVIVVVGVQQQKMTQIRGLRHSYALLSVQPVCVLLNSKLDTNCT